ncbi:MAG: hypothetical protein IT454_12365 [Planctomycetes bacterium]|nr:hypothetical protein [Planctomycetota bacterium]
MFNILRSTLTTAVLALGAWTITAPGASAQCGPDSLDGGPCCASASVTLPLFPNIPQETAKYICYDSCQPSQVRNLCASLGVPKPVKKGGAIVCGQYDIRMQFRDCSSGTLAWNGSVRAAYSRTWLESTAAGLAPINVFRFVINGDFLPGAALGTTPCDRPACLNTYSRIYFTGYIDYALDCATNTWQVAWMLAHECDSIHHPFGSVRPAPATGLHPTRSFAIVGPGTFFAPNSVAPIQSDGPIIQGSMRTNDWSMGNAICRYREPVNGNFVAQNQFCMCVGTGAPQYISSFVQANSICGSSVGPAATAFLQKRLGGWTNPAVFPGTEFVLFDFGQLMRVDACTGVTTIEWYEGGETIGGFPAFDFAGVALGRQFEDLGSANTSPTNPATRIGAPHISNSMLEFNLP